MNREATWGSLPQQEYERARKNNQEREKLVKPKSQECPQDRIKKETPLWIWVSFLGRAPR